MKTIAAKQAIKHHFSNFLAKLRKSLFVKNVLIVMTGTALAQIIGFALTPIISRLFSLADFGIFGSFSSISSIIAAGATLEYSQAIMLPKEKEYAINLLAFSFLCTFAVGFLCLMFCLINPLAVNALMKTDGVWALALLIVASTVAGVNQSCQAWAVRVKAFRHTSASQVIRSISSNGLKIGFGYFKVGAAGLIVSNIVAHILASINLFRVLLPDFLALRGFVRWGLMKRLAKDYRDFPMYSASQNVLNALSVGLPILLLARFHGIAVAGAYAFGINILQVPMDLILSALRQVLFQKASETQHQSGSLATLYVKTTAGLFAITLLPSLIFFMWAPQIFSWIFGSQWYMAGELARSLVIWLAFVFCNLPAVLFARIIRIQRFVFFYNLVLLAARSLALVLGGLYLNPLHTVMAFALVGAAMNVFLIFWVGRAVIRKEGHTSVERIRDYLIGK